MPRDQRANAWASRTPRNLLLTLLVFAALCSFRLESGVAQDTIGNTPETAGAIDPGTFVQSAIDADGDTDWFRVTLRTARTYQWTVFGASSGAGTLSSPNMEIRDETGLIAAETNTPQISFTADRDGTFFVVVKSSSVVSNRTGTYRLTMEPEDEFRRDTMTEGTISPGTSLMSALEAVGDEDWFAVSLLQGRTYGFITDGASSGVGTLSSPNMEIRDETGLIAAETNTPQISFTADRNGTFFVVVKSSSVVSNRTGTYRLTMVPEDEFRQDIATEGTISPGTSLMSALEAVGDEDWFAVSLLQGRTYGFITDGASSGVGTLSSPNMEIRDETGLIAAETNTPQISFTADRNGTFFVVVKSSSVVSNRTGTYRLTMVPEDQQSADLFTTGRISSGGFLSGAIEARGDTDWFALTVVAGRTYEIHVDGATSGVGTLGNPDIVIRDNTGLILTSTSASEIGFTATDNQTIFVVVDGSGNSTGTYRLRVDTAGGIEAQTAILAAILPTSRTVVVGQPATVFVTLINVGSAPGIECRPRDPGQGGLFAFQAADASNASIGDPNTAVDINVGASQSFIVSLTPQARLEAVEIEFPFDCANAPPATPIRGLNTLLLSASTEPIADIIALAATAAGNGIVDVGGVMGVGAFSVATVNVGTSETITVRASTLPPGSDSGLPAPVALTVCETDAATGACLSPPESSVTTSIDANETSTFAIFVQGMGSPVPLDPATARVFVIFTDPNGSIRGATSVAYQVLP